MIVAAGQAGVAHGAANHEVAGRVDVDLRLRQRLEPRLRQHRRQDVLVHALEDVLLLHARVVLGGQHHGVEADDLVVLVAQGDLALGVRAQPLELARLADLGLLLDQAVRVIDRGRHVLRRLVAGVAEHQALVARALLFRLLAVHALVDVGRLLANHVDEWRRSWPSKPTFGIVVADVVDHAARQRLDVDPGRWWSSLAGHDGGAGLHQRLAGHAGLRVLGQDRVQHRIGDLVGHLVRVAFGDRLGGEEVAGHRRLYPLIEMKGWVGRA